jgi:hypothetical protein
MSVGKLESLISNMQNNVFNYNVETTTELRLEKIDIKGNYWGSTETKITIVDKDNIEYPYVSGE